MLLTINTDFGVKGMSSQDLQAVVAAWQSGAISRDTMFELFRKGEILPDGRTNQDEEVLIRAGQAELASLMARQQPQPQQQQQQQQQEVA